MCRDREHGTSSGIFGGRVQGGEAQADEEGEVFGGDGKVCALAGFDRCDPAGLPGGSSGAPTNGTGADAAAVFYTSIVWIGGRGARGCRLR